MFIFVIFASSLDLFYPFEALDIHIVLKKKFHYGVFKTKVKVYLKKTFVFCCCCMKLNYLKLCINICLKMTNASFFILIPVTLYLHKCKFAE